MLSLSLRLLCGIDGEHLYRLPEGLTELKLGGCWNVSSGIDKLPTSLTSLELSLCTIPGSVLQDIAQRMPLLESLGAYFSR
jgi:hypothetical protein